MNEYTKGPWVNSVTGIYAKDGTTIAQVYTQWSNDADEANARLISAAPELLEACKAAENDISLFYDEKREGTNTQTWKVIMKLRTAIAKAEGEEVEK